VILGGHTKKSQFGCYPGLLSGATEEKAETISQDSQSPGQDLNLGLAIYEAEV
jgi:hypothetical protein